MTVQVSLNDHSTFPKMASEVEFRSAEENVVVLSKACNSPEYVV